MRERDSICLYIYIERERERERETRQPACLGNRHEVRALDGNRPRLCLELRALSFDRLVPRLSEVGTGF